MKLSVVEHALRPVTQQQWRFCKSVMGILEMEVNLMANMGK